MNFPRVKIAFYGKFKKHNKLQFLVIKKILVRKLMFKDSHCLPLISTNIQMRSEGVSNSLRMETHSVEGNIKDKEKSN